MRHLHDNYWMWSFLSLYIHIAMFCILPISWSSASKGVNNSLSSDHLTFHVSILFTQSYHLYENNIDMIVSCQMIISSLIISHQWYDHINVIIIDALTWSYHWWVMIFDVMIIKFHIHILLLVSSLIDLIAMIDIGWNDSYLLLTWLASNFL